MVAKGGYQWPQHFTKYYFANCYYCPGKGGGPKDDDSDDDGIPPNVGMVAQRQPPPGMPPGMMPPQGQPPWGMGEKLSSFHSEYLI